MANPLDPGLWILRGFADEGPGAGHGQTGDLDSIAFYLSALAVSPNNSAAHHYLAHSYENIGRTEEALSHSEAYLRVSSAIPHAHHMRGHELRRAGALKMPSKSFEKRTSWRMPTIGPSIFLQSTTGIVLITSASWRCAISCWDE